MAITLGSVDPISVIGFSSETLCGSLLLASPNSVFVHTLSTVGASLADCSGELARISCWGGIESQLLEYQELINVSLPVVIAGGSFALPAKTRALTCYYSFVSDEALFVRFEGELAQGVEPVRQAQAEPSISEGEPLIF